MDPSNSISSDEQTVQAEISTRLKGELYKAALDGNVEAFIAYQGPLHCLVTPNQNTVLHIYLAIPNYRIIAFWPFKFRTPLKNSRSTNFVEEIVNRSPSLLLKPNAKGEIPLQIAARFGHANIVELLVKRAKAEHRHLENGIEPAKRMLRMTDNEENTALHKAIRYGHLDAVHALIQEDPGFSYSVNKSGETPLYIAARRGYHRLVKVILDKCESAKHDGPCGRTALHAAVMAADRRSTREILRKRSNLTKATDENGRTPLHYAAHIGYRYQIVKLLLECDESAAYITDKEKMTPLLMAARQGHNLTMREIINHCPGCCEIVDKRGWNFYHFAAASLPITNLHEIFFGPNCRRLVDEEDIHGNTPSQVFAASRLSPPIGTLDFVTDDMVTIRKDNLDSKKKEQIFQLLDEVGSGEVAGVAVRPLLVRKKGNHQGFDKDREARAVVAGLIVTVTFAAALTLPGGYKSDQGTAMLSHNYAFNAFVIADAIAMISSVLVINFNLWSSRPNVTGRERQYSTHLMAMFAGIAEVALVVAFVTGLYAVLKPSSALAISTSIIILGFFICYYRLSLKIVDVL
ncbi:hypothetical protein POUND7_019179 [Theobroma cacao]